MSLGRCCLWEILFQVIPCVSVCVFAYVCMCGFIFLCIELRGSWIPPLFAEIIGQAERQQGGGSVCKFIFPRLDSHCSCLSYERRSPPERTPAPAPPYLVDSPLQSNLWGSPQLCLLV